MQTRLVITLCLAFSAMAATAPEKTVVSIVRRRVSHQRRADLRGPRLARTQGRGPADELADGPGHLRRPKPRDRLALGLSRHRQMGRRAQHERVHRRDAGMAEARPARVHDQSAGRLAGGLLEDAAVGELGLQCRRHAARRLPRAARDASSTGPTSSAWSRSSAISISARTSGSPTSRLSSRRPTRRRAGCSTAAGATCSSR